MDAKFPWGRALGLALVFALASAVGAWVVARLTLPTAEPPIERSAAGLESGMAGGAGLPVAGAAADSAGAAADSAGAIADSAGVGVDGVAAADSAGVWPDSVLALAGGDTLLAAAIVDSLARVDSLRTALAVAPAAASPVAGRSLWPKSWAELAGAPERYIPPVAAALTFLGALLTALWAVKGARPAVVDDGPVRRRSDAVQLLAVLQREGRLVDFLQEEIADYADAQIGAAVRSVHAGCRKALAEHLEVEPVMDDDEGAAVTVAKGFDPSSVRLTGEVAGDPPFKGALRHRGWRAARVDLPTDARGQDPNVVAPAEVEVRR